MLFFSQTSFVQLAVDSAVWSEFAKTRTTGVSFFVEYLHLVAVINTHNYIIVDSLLLLR